MPDDRSDAQRAYDLGVTATQTKTTLDAHEKRLAAINGSIERSGSELRKIHGCLDELIGDIKTREAVERALSAAVKSAADKQVTTRTFVIGVIGLMLVIVGLYLGAA